jgi:hypothetical protein
MTKRILLGLVLLFFLSCNKDDGNDSSIKQQDGDVWFSGGLAVCAEQIHLDNGDTLIVNLEDIISFRTGDRVNVKYKEIGLNESCTSGIDCEIIEIKKVQ